MEIYHHIAQTHVVLGFVILCLVLFSYWPHRIISEKQACWFAISTVVHIPLVILVRIWS
jgi:hypothetical protein